MVCLESRGRDTRVAIETGVQTRARPIVGGLRPLVLALLDRAAELGKRQHRYVQFLGERLEAAADLGDFLDAVAVARLAGALQELEVVDDDEADVTLALEAARTGAERGDGQAGRVVDIERQPLAIAGGAGEVAAILRARSEE